MLQTQPLTLKMNFKFLENVCQILPSLRWCVDKRGEADEMLTAALPLNTLAQPDAAAKHTNTAHTDCAHYTLERKQICLCLLTNSHFALAGSITRGTLSWPSKYFFFVSPRDPPLSYSSSWCRGASWLSRWSRRARSIGGSCEAGRPRLCRTPASDPTAARRTPSPPGWSPPYRAARCRGTGRPAPPAGWTHTVTVLERQYEKSFTLLWQRMFVEDGQTSLDDSELPVLLRLWLKGSTQTLAGGDAFQCYAIKNDKQPQGAEFNTAKPLGSWLLAHQDSENLNLPNIWMSARPKAVFSNLSPPVADMMDNYNTGQIHRHSRCAQRQRPDVHLHLITSQNGNI